MHALGLSENYAEHGASKTKSRMKQSVMKDQLITALEALRISRAELRAHDARRVKNGPRTIQRLKEILFDDRVTQALRALGRTTKRRALFHPKRAGLARSEYKGGSLMNRAPRAWAARSPLGF